MKRIFLFLRTDLITFFLGTPEALEGEEGGGGGGGVVTKGLERTFLILPVQNFY